ncbi:MULTISPECIES: DUF4400 domain-containing protein [Massilia]|jgi:hypothetical protein|uniref:DUF4400 domain-containing protein n=1 Tax=Massilia TaxID=149698 RepID=UPI0004E44C93|nr:MULTISPECIES: DUF4400 domain-containing protein [Massilia]KFC72613.1 hypothetical protein FG94_01790 [Massilia sp. LC238]
MAIHPVSVQNSFGSHFILWSFFLPILALIFVPLVVPDQTLTQSEVEMVAALGVDVAAMTQTVDQRFASLFVENGFMAKTQQFFGTSKGGILDFSNSWIHGVWLMLYKATWRFFALKSIFLLPLLVLAIPAAVDGFMVRATKKYRFENSNPVFFYSSMHTMVLMFGMFAFLPLAPFSLSAITLLTIIVLLIGGIWLTTSNFQTGT